MKPVYDLHLHSSFSDGDLSPGEVMSAFENSAVKGVALTDHNGIWGLDEARAMAEKLNLTFLNGIEISARYEDYDLHVLGLARSFKTAVLQDGLEQTRMGYELRLREMITLCQEAGYEKITLEGVMKRRSHIAQPAYISYDLAATLRDEYGVTFEEARKLTITGGACHVPYGSDWVLGAGDAIDLIHQAGGVAIWAHPGVVPRDRDQETLDRFLNAFVSFGVDGLEVHHPAHDGATRTELEAFAHANGLLTTGGSDWHGPGRYADSDAEFGSIGCSEKEFAALLRRIDEIAVS